MGEKKEERSLTLLKKALLYSSVIAVIVAAASWIISNQYSSKDLEQAHLIVLESDRVADVMVWSPLDICILRHMS